MNKRHAKPTTAIMINRLYRRQIKLETLVTQLSIQWRDAQQRRGPTPGEEFTIFLRSITGEQREIRGELGVILSGQKMLSERMESFRVLADHCARLLREKETLQKMMQALKDSEAYMSYPLRRWEMPS